MSKRGVNIVLALCFVMNFGLLQAQDIRAKASVTKDHILVGEPVILQLEAEYPTGTSINWFSLDSLAHFEILDTGKLDTLASVGGNLLRQTFTITSYDSGSRVIPRMSVTVNNKKLLTDSLKIEVGYSSAEPAKDYHDLKDIIEVPAVEPLYINYIIAFITVLAITALVLLLRKKKQLLAEEPKIKGPKKSPFEVAMASLETLKKARLPENGQFKTYIIQLNEILRQYLKEEKIVIAPDASNNQLVLAAKNVLENDDLIELAQILRLADAVKFARYQPTGPENEQAINGIGTAIENINRQIHKITGN
ncbi:BatD family protein [Flavihumibacter profundi]|uniref:BatD family protein n=1 Tax=Flavihumibacter profundi TaxID=2716883 RepID=UPI001CC77B69|nr:BatD family protein [Flavihumibacter profundi]MBZ5858509.1 BatD family protein [Flavihumibacter profundi]